MKAPQNRWLIAGSVFCITALVFACLVPVSTNPVTETYQMKWTIEPYRRCATYVVLGFETAPGYIIRACSKELLETLEAAGVNPVPVRFTRTAESHFRITTWHYKIEQVGDWVSTTSFSGLALRCSYQAGEDPDDSPCGKAHSPIRDPHTIK